jgi:hypothetical protein
LQIGSCSLESQDYVVLSMHKTFNQHSTSMNPLWANVL